MPGTLDAGPGTGAILAALAEVVDPELGAGVLELGMVRSVRLADGRAEVGVALTTAACPLRDVLRRSVEEAALGVPGVDSVHVSVATMDQDERRALMERARAAAQQRGAIDVGAGARILGVVSGKGGVGKSSVSVNLAASLAERGAVVGLLDADIWGFSVPRLLGLDGPLEVRDKKMQPHERRVGLGTLRVVSMGLISGEDDAIMWRGLILNRAVQHFLEDVAWGRLDYLVVDLPPGTGDVQLGFARMLPGAELIVVTTPALGAQKVAGRAADLARRAHLRVAGVVENMAGFTAPDGTTYDVFGSGGGDRLAAELGVPLLASVPLDPGVSRNGDLGRPVALEQDSPLRPVFAELARRLDEELAPPGLDGCSARIERALAGVRR